MIKSTLNMSSISDYLHKYLQKRRTVKL
uniref:Uncharacterized protein n=1 Tax=Arundo donax TaxID=35708 RepID=A0A0A9BZS1_ARUDO